MIAFRYGTNRRYVSDPQPAIPDLAADLEDRIDPNHADEATLAVLPMIGEKRAADIVRFREKFEKDHPGQVAFRRVEDLTRIRGIGPATLLQVSPYLIFPTTAPAISTTP